MLTQRVGSDQFNNDHLEPNPLTWRGGSDQFDDRLEPAPLPDRLPVLRGLGALSNRAHNVGEDLEHNAC